MRSVCFVFVFVLFARISFSEDARPKNAIEDNVLTLFTKWRAGESGPFQFPLPSLDEITMPSVSGNYEGYGTRITYSTNNLTMSGLKEFSVEQVDISDTNLKAAGIFTVPTVLITTDKYRIYGKALWFLPIDGSGALNITVNKIQLNISIRLRNNSTRMWVDKLQLSFRVGSVNANLENGPSAIALLINKSGVSIIQSYHDDIVKAVQALMIPAVEEFLKGNEIVTPDQLFSLLQEVHTPPPNVVRV